MAKTQIEEQINDNEYARQVMLGGGINEEGSVGHAANMEDVEVQSPAPRDNLVDIDLDELYLKLGKAHMEVKRIELIILRKTT
jgi:hypothetical protein